jgi:hypothetical protein
MPKKPVKKQQDANQRDDVDIIEIEEYPGSAEPNEESEEEEEVPVSKTTKKKPGKREAKAKKQVGSAEPNEVESESESESEEEEVPQKKKSSKKKIALPPIILQAPEKVKKPLTEKRAAAIARGREKQKAIREQRKNESLEKMKKELWEDFQKQGSSAAPSVKGTVKEQKEKEPVTDPLEHIKKMKESLPKQDERKHDVSGLFGPVQIRSFRK